MISIVFDNGSKENPQLATKSSEHIHGVRCNVQIEPKIDVSKSVKTDKKNVKTIAQVDKKQAPLMPMKRPKAAQETKLKNGKISIQKYIKILVFY